jgi:hypothetical protein
MYEHFDQSQIILITGCGGGYDVFAGIDIAFNLMSQGKKVIFGNFTFTQEQLLKGVVYTLLTVVTKSITHVSYE